jgi:hypothetical protein
MDGRRFDYVARTLAEGVSRRETVRRMIATTLGIGLAVRGSQGGEAITCRTPGQACRENANCCNGMCGPSDPSGRRFCLCDDGAVSCRGKCCVFSGATCYLGQCEVLAAAPTVATATLWHAVFEMDALAPTLAIVGFAPVAGQRFQLRVAPTGAAETLVDCEVIEVDYPTRVVFTWRVASTRAPATAAFTLRQTELGPRLGVNRVAGDPASCDVANVLLGRNWQRTLFAEALPQYLERTRQG